jgi:hypothetical protein
VTPVTMGNGQLRLDEVYLSGSTGQGPAVVGGLALVADEQGLNILGPQPSSVRTMPWSRVSSMATRETANLPDGRAAVILDVEIQGQALRFIVPKAVLGPEGMGILEGRLSQIARMQVHPAEPLADPSGMASAPPGVVAPGPVPSLGAPGSTQGGAFAPATGGTLLGGQTGPVQQYVQVGKKHAGRARRLATVGVVVLILAGAGVYYQREHKAAPIVAASADSLIAAAVNLNPGQLPGWKGVPGTTAGVLGAYGFRDSPAGQSPVLQRASSGFAECTKLPASQSEAALTTLGFSDGAGPVVGQTAISASPLFEDPAQPATSAESSALVLTTSADQTEYVSAFAGRDFALCYSRFLDAVVPDLVGGPLAGLPFAYASVQAVRTQPVHGGTEAAGFTETFMRKGRVRTAALSGSIEVVGGGRTIAVVETLSARRFPTLTESKLFDTVQESVASELSS